MILHVILNQLILMNAILALADEDGIFNIYAEAKLS